MSGHELILCTVAFLGSQAQRQKGQHAVKLAVTVHCGRLTIIRFRSHQQQPLLYNVPSVHSHSSLHSAINLCSKQRPHAHVLASRMYPILASSFVDRSPEPALSCIFPDACKRKPTGWILLTCVTKHPEWFSTRAQACPALTTALWAGFPQGLHCPRAFPESIHSVDLWEAFGPPLCPSTPVSPLGLLQSAATSQTWTPARSGSYRLPCCR